VLGQVSQFGPTLCSLRRPPHHDVAIDRIDSSTGPTVPPRVQISYVLNTPLCTAAGGSSVGAPAQVTPPPAPPPPPPPGPSCPGKDVFFDPASCELDAEGKSTGCIYSLKDTASGREGHCDPVGSGRRLQAGYELTLMEFWSGQPRASLSLRADIHLNALSNSYDRMHL
jgi:hypothetical protein